jgi:hypothetical protein
MFFTIALDVLVAAYILSRQRRIRPVRRVLSLRLPIVLGVIGLINLLSYTDTHHHITTTEWLFVLATFAVGAVALGAIRAFTVQLWTSNNWIVRQGTWLTMGLWVLSLALHFVSGAGAKYVDAGNLEASSFLLYLGLTYGVQNYVIHRRAVPLWEALGPEAGQRLQVNFGPGPGGTGAFFATFRGGQDFGPGPGRQPRGQTPANDPTIIDAEVVEDGKGPPELH